MGDEVKPYTMEQLRELVSDLKAQRDFAIPLAASALPSTVAALDEARRERDQLSRLMTGKVTEHKSALVDALTAERDEARARVAELESDCAKSLKAHAEALARALDALFEHIADEPDCHRGHMASENGDAYEDCSNGCEVGSKVDAAIEALNRYRKDHPKENEDGK